MIRVTFACGHRLTLADASSAPVCPACGETRVTRTAAPAPRFRGTALGPCAQYDDLPPVPVWLNKET